MTLTELQTEVATITNRPDLTAQILLAVRRATLALHHTDFFYKDLFETGVNFLTPAFIHDLEYQVVVPRWRAVSYLRIWDNVGGTPLQQFEIIDPLNALDSYALDRDYVAYAAGSVFHLRSRTEFQHILLGCYLNPDISILTYDSWIARDHPYTIVMEAAATVFKMIGKDDEAAAMRLANAVDIQSLKISNVQPQGY